MARLQEDFKRHLQRGRFFDKDDRVVVAVSTGVDSMTLLYLLETLPDALRPQLVVAHVNHELREQSVEEEQFIRQYCRQHHLKLVVQHWPKSQHPRTGEEAAARQFRYRFFKETMKKFAADILLTAHHQNDLAETMLMKLVRGGQLSQLVGIADERPLAGGKLVRPLLPFPKRRLQEFARATGLTWYEDKTNTDLAITRNRYRHEIIPALEKENPRLLDHLTSYHQQLTDLLAWQSQQLDSQLVGITHDGQLMVDKWQQQPLTIQMPLLQRWLEKRVVGIKQAQLAELVTALKNPATPQQELPLPNGDVLVQDYGKCFIQTAENLRRKPQNGGATVVELGQWYFVNDQQLMVAVTAAVFSNTAQLQEMWLAPDQFPLTLRLWAPTDTLRLKNGGRQKVRRVLIDQKVPNEVREKQFVLVDANGTVVWLVGRKWSWFTRPRDYRQRWRKVIIGTQDK